MAVTGRTRTAGGRQPCRADPARRGAADRHRGDRRAALDRTTAGHLLAKARGIAGQTGEGNHLGTAFGPVNVTIHEISASLRFGDPRTAAETGEALDLTVLPEGLVGRRTQVHLDLARAYAMRRQDAAAVNLLLAAERLVRRGSRGARWQGPPVGSFTERDRLKEELPARFAGWRIWYVPRLGGTTWFAQPRPSLAAATAAQLAGLIEEAGPGEPPDAPEFAVPVPVGPAVDDDGSRQ